MVECNHRLNIILNQLIDQLVIVVYTWATIVGDVKGKLEGGG